MIRIFGNIEGILEGDIFDNRIELSLAKVHRPTQAGISGSENEGADSIVISGGYEDDEDLGDVIIYTGHGGRSNNSKVQVADQTLTRGNKALALSCEEGYPVRVVRGIRNPTEYLGFGYRYDGLFRVEDYWKEIGKSGFIVWRFRLVKINLEKNVVQISLVNEEPESYGNIQRKEILVQRIVRDTYKAKAVKAMYNYECQICKTAIITEIGRYAEAAHIQALGNPHNGPDVKENILCLCPNHHVMFDYGLISISDNYKILGLENSKLIVHTDHRIGINFLEYHRIHFYKGNLNRS